MATIEDYICEHLARPLRLKDGSQVLNDEGKPVTKEEGIPVVAYDKEGNRVKEFRSIAEAARWCGCDTRTIHRVLKGIKHSHKNLVWKRKF